MTDFIGNSDVISDFSEIFLRCTASRDARFIGKKVSSASGSDGYGHTTMSLYVTRSGTYVMHHEFKRIDGSTYSKHHAFVSESEVHDVISTVGNKEIAKKVIWDAGLDNSVEIP